MSNRIPEPDIIGWLMEHCQHDRVLFNALNNHRHPPCIAWNAKDKVWMVDAVKSRSGRRLWVFVAPHPVTGEPNRYYRYKEWDMEVRGYGIDASAKGR